MPNFVIIKQVVSSGLKKVEKGKFTIRRRSVTVNNYYKIYLCNASVNKEETVQSTVSYNVKRSLRYEGEG
jgi:uncharacterized protein YprB with RNaseH-like and TPR domain